MRTDTVGNSTRPLTYVTTGRRNSDDKGGCPLKYEATNLYVDRKEEHGSEDMGDSPLGILICNFVQKKNSLEQQKKLVRKKVEHIKIPGGERNSCGLSDSKAYRAKKMGLNGWRKRLRHQP